MAYTYDTFLNAAKSTGMYDAFGQEDLIIAQKNPEYGLSLLKLQQDAGKATTEEQKLLVQEAINQLRNTYGTQVTTPVTGTQTSTAPVTGSSFVYDNENSYQKLLDEVSTPDSFQYDHRQDPGYGAVKDSWLDDGNATREKVLSNPSATQGVQSSWAGTAAQQSNNYYDTKLNDQIPAIRQNAYEEYLGNQGVQQGKLDALEGDRAFDYAAYAQQLQMDQQKAQQKFDNDMALHTTFGTETPTMPDLTGLADGSRQLITPDGTAAWITERAAQTGHTLDQKAVAQYLAQLAGKQTTIPNVDTNIAAQYIAEKAGEKGYPMDPKVVAKLIDELKAANKGGYTYGKGNEYQEALDAVVEQDPFAYNHVDDPLYGSLRKTYLREGERAMEDTMAELNAATGGVANSYSVRAAADAGNAYNESLNAAIPDLRRTAYQEYLDGFEGKLQGLAQMEEDRAFDYEKWLQNYQLQEAARQQEFNNAMSLYEQIGLTPEIAAILGVPYEEPSSSSGGGGTPKEDLDSYTVANKTGDGWIQVGSGRITDDSLQKKVASGEIIAKADKKTKTITYTYASKKK